MKSLRLILLTQFLVFNTISTSLYGQTRSDRENILDLETRLELFIDNYLIDSISSGVRKILHHPIARELVLHHDDPWEGSGSGYHSIFKDGNNYRMYYKAWQHSASSDTALSHPLFCAYAESNDGIYWYKPKLNIHEFRGSKENNIVLVSGLIHNFNIDAGHPAVFIDDNPNINPDEKFKAIVTLQNPEYGLVVLKSPDGLNWNLHNEGLMMKNDHFDSQNTAFWDDRIKKYRAYWRHYDKNGIRGIRTATSTNLFDWGEIYDLKYGNSTIEHLYTNQIKPYYRAPHLLIGLPLRYIDRGWSESMKSLPELQEREKRAGKTTKGGSADLTSRFGTVLTETLLIASRDGINFKKWDEAFLRPGIERNGSWTYGDNCTAWQIVETKSDLPGAPNELSLYSVENYWKGRGSALRRYTLRIDGFVSLNAGFKGGTVITKPLTFTGDQLWLNFSTSAAGGILTEIQDKNGNPFPGFAFEDSETLFGDSISKQALWKNKNNLSELSGKIVRIKFYLKDADLYSMKFGNN